MTSDAIGGAIERIRQKLLDLTLRNKLLNYRERPRAIRIVDELPNNVFYDLTTAQRSFEFLPVDPEGGGLIDLQRELPTAPADPEAVAPRHQDTFLQTRLPADQLEKRLRELRAEARRAIEETGSNTLYLAFGFLHWQDKASQKEVSAPLILLPVTLQRSRVRRGDALRYKYVLSANEEDLEDNLSLAEKLLRDYGLVLPRLYAGNSNEERDEPLEPEDFFERVAETVAEMPGWRVARELVLDLFSFSKLYLYRDLDVDAWPESTALNDHAIVRELILGADYDALDEIPEVYAVDEHATAADLPLLFDADSAQISAMIDALEGRSLVLEGPPGTGKSQTICNLIGAFLASGKTVLFLSEKLAALEVVKARLDDAGLGPFVLELHSHEISKRQLHSNLRQRIEHRMKRAKVPADIREERDALRDELNHYAAEMNLVVGKTGLTAFDVFWRLERCRVATPDLVSVELSDAMSWDRRAFERRAELAAELGGHVGDRVPRQSPWYGVYPVELTPGNRSRLGEDLRDFRGRLQELNAQFEPLQEMVGEVADRSLAALKHFSQLDPGALVGLPPGFEQRYCQSMAEARDAEDLEDLSARILAIEERRRDAGRRLRYLAASRDEALLDLRKRLSEADVDGLGGMPFGQLVEAQNVVEQLCGRLQALRKVLGEHLELGYDLPRTFGELTEIHQFLTFAVNETPAEASLYTSPKLFRGDVRELVERGEAEANQLLREHGRELLSQIRLEQMPSVDELRQMLADLESGTGFWSRLSNEYRQARAGWERLDKQDKREPEEIVALCRDVVLFFDKRREFVESIEYQDGLDWIFRGLDTDWKQALRIAEWADRLVVAAPSRKTIQCIREDFDGTLAICRDLCHVTQQALDDVPRLAERLRELTRHLETHLLDLDTQADAPLFNALTRLERAGKSLKQMVSELEMGVVSPTSTLAELGEAVDLERCARQDAAALEARRDRWRELVGEDYTAEATEMSIWRAHLAWRSTLREAGVPNEVIAWLLLDETPGRGERLHDFYSQLQAGEGTLDDGIALFEAYGRLEADRFFRAGSEGEPQLPAIIAKVDACVADLDNVLAWADACRAADEARAHGLGPMVEALDDGRLRGEDASAAFRLSFYRSLSHRLVEERPALGKLSRERWTVASQRFRELDRACQTVDRRRVIRALKKRRAPAGRSTGPTRQRTQMGLIRREIQKVRNHIPVRALVDRAQEALIAMKPCFMMSPLSVARFLPPGSLTFDVLIMDEASQLRPEECLGAIARSKQVVIVGDPNQLPPTSFFDAGAGEALDREDETVLDDVESVLDIALLTWGRGRRLIWHYRSQHQDLIRFSNHHFYQGSLTVFPSPRPEVEELGVVLEPVAGAVFEKGVNPVEAEAVAAATLKHMAQRANESLGVVAFNGRQRDLIASCVERLLATDPALLVTFESFQARNEPFFVKNLENVQGDERDVILISGTYGPDPETGKVYQRFGPIIQERGWRRLNVIFTRARRQVRMFSSFEPEAIKLTDKTSEGARMLRAYLEYARDARASAAAHSSGGQSMNAFQEAMVELLDELGYEAHVDVGVSGCFVDVAVLDPERPGEYLVGLVSDGPHYWEAACARDRDRLRFEVLSRLGWRLLPIVTTDWWKSRERNRQLLVQELEKARSPEGDH